MIERSNERDDDSPREAAFLGSFFSMITLGAMVFYQLGGFLVSVLVARESGVEGLGSYHYFVAVTTLIALLSKHGADEEVVYTAEVHGGLKSAAAQDFMRGILASSLLYSVAASLLFLAVELSSIKIFGVPEKGMTPPVIVVSASIFSFYSILCAILRSESMFISRALFTYIFPLVMLFSIYIAIALLHGRASDFINEIRVASYIFSAAGMLWFVWRRFELNLLKITPRIKISLRRSTWLGLSIVSFLFETGFAVLWVGSLTLDANGFGELAFVIRIGSIIMLAPMAILVVFGARLASAKPCRRLAKLVVSLNLAISIFIFIVIQISLTSICDLFGVVAKPLELQVLTVSSAFLILAISQPVYAFLIGQNKQWVMVTSGFLLLIFFAISCLIYTPVDQLDILARFFMIVGFFVFLRLYFFWENLNQ